MEDFVTDMARQGTTTFSKLLDARAATTDISAHDVQQIVGILERMAKGEKLGRAAIVVADNVSYGMARMMSALIEGTVSIHAFREIKEAEEWLGWDGEASSAAGSPAM
ncbi:MAG: hypothetical protein K1X78_00865 [Verrucomicrobiaceae bacterium]|nr:hypothetical protein [Verrucomicrobiaceae bacterium]